MKKINFTLVFILTVIVVSFSTLQCQKEKSSEVIPSMEDELWYKIEHSNLEDNGLYIKKVNGKIQYRLEKRINKESNSNNLD